MDKLLILIIDFYKKNISLRKGFSCAHRVLHGGSSCSTFIRSSIEELGWLNSIKLIPTRAKECALAAKKLDEEEEENTNPPRRKQDHFWKYCLGETLGNAACCFFWS